MTSQVVVSWLTRSLFEIPPMFSVRNKFLENDVSAKE